MSDIFGEADPLAAEKHCGGSALGWAQHVGCGEPFQVVDFLQGTP